MKTKFWIVDKDVEKELNQSDIAEVAGLLRNGEVIAFPTETVYGLGANALDEKAVEKIFIAKGRPSDNPLIVHLSDADDMSRYVSDIPEVAKKLATQFWPGPLTIVLQKKVNSFPDIVTAGLETVGIRIPDHPIALSVIRAAGVPVAAPSANKSGRPSPTTAAHVEEDMSGLIAGIIDGGRTAVGLESTVIDCTVCPPMILRLGGITTEEIASCIGAVQVDPGLVVESITPKSPGMKYTHYAPKAEFVLVEGTPSFLQSIVDGKRKQGIKVGIYTVEERRGYYQADVVLAGGSEADLNSVAEEMYSILRQFDQTDVAFIYGETFSDMAIGSAIMNRLQKAAAGRIITEKKF